MNILGSSNYKLMMCSKLSIKANAMISNPVIKLQFFLPLFTSKVYNIFEWNYMIMVLN